MVVVSGHRDLGSGSEVPAGSERGALGTLWRRRRPLCRREREFEEMRASTVLVVVNVASIYSMRDR